MILGAIVARRDRRVDAGRCAMWAADGRAGERGATFRLAKRDRQRSRQDQHLVHGHGRARHRRDLCAAADPAQRLVDIGFIIAFALQGAIWARELILGYDRARVGEAPSEVALGKRSAIIRRAGQRHLVRDRVHRHPRQSRRQRHRARRGLGIGGIAIGLAAQGIFSDLFAALAILFDKPFRRGDTIRFGTTTGTVERIGLKTTRLRSLSGEQVVMANTKLLEREIHNSPAAASRRNVDTLRPRLPDPARDASNAWRKSLTRAIEAGKGCKFDRCGTLSFGPSSIDCEVVYGDRSEGSRTRLPSTSRRLLSR